MSLDGNSSFYKKMGSKTRAITGSNDSHSLKHGKGSYYVKLVVRIIKLGERTTWSRYWAQIHVTIRLALNYHVDPEVTLFKHALCTSFHDMVHSICANLFQNVTNHSGIIEWTRNTVIQCKPWTLTLTLKRHWSNFVKMVVRVIKLGKGTLWSRYWAQIQVKIRLALNYYVDPEVTLFKHAFWQLKCVENCQEKLLSQFTVVSRMMRGFTVIQWRA